MVIVATGNCQANRFEIKQRLNNRANRKAENWSGISKQINKDNGIGINKISYLYIHWNKVRCTPTLGYAFCHLSYLNSLLSVIISLRL